MLEVSALGWTITILVILALLALDLIIGTLKPHAVGFKEAVAWSVFYIGVAVVFGVVFASISGWEFGTQYFAGCARREEPLGRQPVRIRDHHYPRSRCPAAHQQRVLTFGIVLALAVPGDLHPCSAPRCCRCSRSCS